VNPDPLAAGADEEIIGIPREIALAHGTWTGFQAFSSVDTARIEIARLDAAGIARPRRALEQDAAWKQPIPYAIALYRDPETSVASLFWMDRLSGTSDQRLHGRASFGVGGHISASDGGIRAALEREWREEVDTPALPAFTPLGLLNDDADAVGRVHLGIVFLATLTSPKIAIRERNKLAGSLLPVADAVSRTGELEGWSARLIGLIAGLAI
jgi:hypothetical protein